MTQPSVVLIAPPNPAMVEPRVAPPLGLLALAAYGRAHGFDGEGQWTVVDLNVACYPPGPAGPQGHGTHDFSMERCLAEIPTGADVYGIGFASAQCYHARAICAALRAREPRAVLVCGGPHPSALPDECAEESVPGAGDAFDAVVTGEGEIALHQILERVRDGAFRSGSVTSGAAIGIKTLPRPARDLLDWSRYVRKIGGQPATNILTGRGCPGRCAFCQQESLWGRGLRQLPVSRVMEEVDDIHRTTGIRNLLFLDDSLTARPQSHVVSLASGLRERGVLWRGWTRADLVTRPQDGEMLRAMWACGCQALCLGVEAGSDSVLRWLGKRTTVEQNRAAIRAVHRAGIDCRVSVMTGCPGETWADVDALVRFLASERGHIADWILSSFVPLPGTPAWDRPEEYGILLDKAAARRDHYRGFFVVGGAEESPVPHRYTTADQEDLRARHACAQEALLRLVPRDRVRVTIGRS